MKKREYKEQERQRHYYFFDYLFWLGEMAQWHYKGEPRRPDGESMLMLCIMIFIYEPIFLTTAHFLFDSTVFEWFTVAMIAGIVAILHYLSNGRIYPFSRREAVMQHYEGRRFSPFSCYFFLFSLGFLMIAEMYLLPSTLMRIDGRKAEPVENTRTEVPQRWPFGLFFSRDFPFRRASSPIRSVIFSCAVMNVSLFRFISSDVKPQE